MVDPRPYQSTADKSEADLALTNLQISGLNDAIRAARARQLQLQADAAYDKQYLERIEPLLRRHFVTANDVFNARMPHGGGGGRGRQRTKRSLQSAERPGPVWSYQCQAQSR